MPLWLSLEPRPERLIRMLRVIASRARKGREELAAIPDDAAPLEVALELLGIAERHCGGLADELEELTAEDTAHQRADDDGWKPAD